MVNIPAVGSIQSSTRDAVGPVGEIKQKGKSNSQDDVAKLKSSAQEFEALFLGYMLNVMRSTIEESDLTEKGLGQSTYTELFDQEVARSLAKRRALGIADLLVRNLTPQVVSPEPETAGGAVRQEGLREESKRALSPALPQKTGKQ
jgi:Rod binding domain-containing protein